MLSLATYIASFKSGFLTSREKFSAFAKSQWQVWQPRLNKMGQLGTAAITSFSMLRQSVQIFPIVLSMLTVLSTLPLFSAVLPTFVFQVRVMLPIMLAVSIYVGYRKYCEQVEREKLDNQTRSLVQQNATQEKQIATLENKITALTFRVKQCPHITEKTDSQCYQPSHSCSH